jgi:hypothetical protein
MIRSQRIPPIAGEWYESHGQLFEVVAVDDTEHVVAVQHADGDLEEIEAEDWAARCNAGALQPADPPEDIRIAADIEDDDALPFAFDGLDEVQQLRASPLEDLDLFSTGD